MRIRKSPCGHCKKEKNQDELNQFLCKSCKSKYEKQRRIEKRLMLGKPAERPVRIAYCDLCQKKLSDGFDIRGKCTKCRIISNRLRLEAKRIASGKPPTPIKDSKFCHVCKIEKTNGRCIPCRYKRRSELKKKKREEAGKRPWGSGRPETCYQCGSKKEHIRRSFCNTCQSEKDKIKWKVVILPKTRVRDTSGKCSCGNNATVYNKSYCKPCLAIKAKLRRERIRLLNPREIKKRFTEEERKLRKSCRKVYYVARRNGFLPIKPCEVCGDNEYVEAHHDDYNKPLDVRWLCKNHHHEYHHGKG